MTKQSNGHAQHDSASSEIVVTDFTISAALEFRKKIIRASKQDPNKPIIVYISSYGGYVDALANMVETIESVPNKIITVCLGHAMSCGAILLSFGDYRFIGKHSKVMVHEVSAGAIGDVHDVYSTAEDIKEMNEHWLGQLAVNCGFKDYNDLREYIKSRDGRDIYLNAEEAVEFGIVDNIGMPEVEPVQVHQILITPDRDKTERRTSPFSQHKPKPKKKRTTKKKVTKKKTSKKPSAESTTGTKSQ